MKPLVLDFETYFDRRDYSLSRMSTEAYVRDPRFEPHGCAVWFPQEQSTPVWLDRIEMEEFCDVVDWTNVYLICHHTHFDGFILRHYFGVRPRLYGCTLSMARLLLGNHLSVSLDSVRKNFGIAAKVTPYNLFEGKHWHELTPDIQKLVADGAIDEVQSIWKIFNLLLPQVPQEELDVIDSVVSMFCDPVLRADTKMLGDLWASEATRKNGLMDELGVDEDELQSSDKFACLLREEGVEPETKTSPKGKEIYAFAKTDQFMRDLLEDERDRVRCLAEARLGVKSTILQTRAETLGWMASRGPLPVYLRYAGAGTLRVSGGDGANWLNFKRGSAIRKSILAPDGYVLGPIDASQIEFRCGHYLAGGPDALALQRLRNGEDPYIATASKFYKREIYRPKKDDPRREEMEACRGLGKQGELMCIYGASGNQFRISAKNGLYGPPVDIPLDGPQSANEFVSMWRLDNPHIAGRPNGYWSACEYALKILNTGATYEFGPITAHMHKLYLPNGAFMNYDSLEWHVPDADEDCRDFERQGYWRLKTRQGWKKMWGSKLTQNICEAVSRVIVSQAMLRIKAMGFRTLNWPYDELLVLLPKDGHEDKNLESCMVEMKREVAWLPGLPLDCDGSIGERYSK
jgi:hypothetical protein